MMSLLNGSPPGGTGAGVVIGTTQNRLEHTAARPTKAIEASKVVECVKTERFNVTKSRILSVL